MIRILSGITVLCVAPVLAQQEQPRQNSVPLYRVTVVQRDVSAVNYQYRSGPTKIDFKGTVLLPDADGEATVESRKGRTEIRADFDDLVAPSRFGAEYLTYVLWAISPEGAPQNLGEIVTDSGDDGKLHVTTELQVFGMIVTAEPYATVRQPSDVVVLQNEVRPDTVGRVQPIQAKVELMPRGHYTFDRGQAAAQSDQPRVSMREYEALSQMYQAQNAVNIARAAGAAEHAPNTMAEAERMLAEAQRLHSIKAGTSLIVQSARAAAQTAEDARLIAERRAQEQKIAEAQTAVAEAERARLQAETAAQQARAEAEAARARADAERQARERAEARAAAASQADRTQPVPAPVQTPARREQGQLRMRLLESLNGVASAQDTPRGIVVTVPDSSFNGSTLHPADADRLARVAAIVASHPGLRIEVEGNTDHVSTEAVSVSRAQAVHDALVRGGLAAGSVAARGLGASRPIADNSTEAGRLANRRVEIVISGDPIGTLPFWDRTYRITVR